MAAVLINIEQRSALLDLLSNFSTLFWGPNLSQCGALRVKDYFRPFDHLSSVLGTEARIALEKLKEMVPGYPDATSLFNSLEEEYIPLFVNARGGIAAPLYQSCYAENKDLPDANTLMGAPAAMMQQRLDTAGLSADHNSNEPP
ncbi:MAG: molecular chaperone TorD family protein, partial [Desulfobacterales bacterium]|nr:molecular chaperone TorD family protein [Desulfobacterales bacterium]